MNKLSFFAALVTAALISITAGSAWSDEATPTGANAPAVQTPAPTSGFAPGRYPPPPNRGRYAQPWQPRTQWAMPPRGYGQMPPHYPPQGQYRTAPAAPAPAPMPAAAENPLSAELKQAQAQLAAKSAELDMAHATLEQLQARLQSGHDTERSLNEKVAQIISEQQALQARTADQAAALNKTTAILEQYRQQLKNDQQLNRTLTAERDQLHNDLASRDAQLAALQAELQAAMQALQQAQAETTTSGQQFNAARAQSERLRNELIELTAQLDNQKTMLQNTEQARAADRDSLRSTLTSRDQQLDALQAELQAATQALQQARAETAGSGQQLSDARAQAERFNLETSELKTQLGTWKTTLQEAGETLAAVKVERDGLLEDLNVCSRKLAQAQTDLTTAQAELIALQPAPAAAAEIVEPPAPASPDEVIEPAASEAPDAGTAEVAAMQIAAMDADADGVADDIDLCPETQQGSTVDATGCAAGVAIKLEGVNFLYNSHELTDKARSILDRVAGIINQQPDMRLEVAGHTDATGDPSYNQWLSMQRAEAVRDYLVAQGVNPRHIGATGYGGQRPIADNNTVEGLQNNRRVELRRLR